MTMRRKLGKAILGLAITLPLVWGAHAQAKRHLIEAATAGERLLLQANHPSPLSALRGPAPFMGCRHFSAAQAWLNRRGADFSWNLEN